MTDKQIPQYSLLSALTATDLFIVNGPNLNDTTYKAPASVVETYFDALYQPLDAQLTDIAALAVTDGNFIVGDGTNFVAESGATARTSLGLGTMAIEAAADYVSAAGDTMTGDLVINTNLQIGTGTTYKFNYAGEGDLYSEDGKGYLGAGLVSVAQKYGSALLVRPFTPTTTLVYASVNATFTVATQTIEKAGETFVSDGVIAGDLVSIISSTPDYSGLVGEILEVTETTIVISLAATGIDSILDATAVNFGVFSSPMALFLDNGFFHFDVGSNTDTNFHIHDESGVNIRGMLMEAVAGVDNYTMMDIEVDAGAYGGVSALIVDFDASAFSDAATLGTILDVAINNTGATAGDIHGLDIALADPANTNVEVEALATHTGVDVIAQYLGTPTNLDAGFSYENATFTDRTTAFNQAGTDVEIFSSDNDVIYLASTSKFDEINVALNTPSNRNILPTFEYSVADGSWVAFTPSDDTEGFRFPATIRFEQAALTTWGQRTVNEVTGESGAVDYYWVRITRTRGSLSTPPIEDTIHLTALGTKLGWDSIGRLTIKTYSQAGEPDTSDLPSEKMCFWVDTDNSKLYLCYNHSGTIKTVELT